MKTRHSLVSNSSSSSFICSRPILAVAKDMWKAICASNDTVKNYKKYLPLISKICKRKDVQSGLYGISLPSCNEDTEILVIDKQCKINTCWNHDWSDIDDLVALNVDDKSSALPSDTFFYSIVAGGKLIRQVHKTSMNKKLICRKCKAYWGLQNIDACNRADYHYEDPDGNTYCPEHFIKLSEELKQ